MITNPTVSLFYRISNEPSITNIVRGNVFPITFTFFYIFVELRPALTFNFNTDLKITLVHFFD
jgi:hypothetical protein